MRRNGFVNPAVFRHLSRVSAVKLARLWIIEQEANYKKDYEVIVSASTECWPDLELNDAIEVLSDLDFTAVEIAIHESGKVKPSEILEDPDRGIQMLRHTHRLEISGYSVELDSTGDQMLKDFAGICKVAKTTKVVNITVPSSEQGTPFNEEVERLEKLVKIGEEEGVRVSVKCQLGCMSEDPDALKTLCKHIEGLGVTLDPSVFISGPHGHKNLDEILKYVCNVHLRDSRPDAFQVSVGQGEVDYGKIVTQMSREKYDRAMTVHMVPIEGLDHRVELRKLRRLLETLI